MADLNGLKFGKAATPPAEDQTKTLGGEPTQRIEGASESVQEAENEKAADAATQTSETQELSGENGPGEQRQFGSHGRQDKNDEIRSEAELEAIQVGADQQSAAAQNVNADAILGTLAGQERAASAPDDSTTYSSFPIARYSVGRFDFENGTLVLNAKDAAEFDALMETMPPREQAQVRKIDASRGELVAKSFLESKRVRGVDTSTDRPNV